MKQVGVAGLHAIQPAQEVLRGQAAQEQDRRVDVRNVVGQDHHPVRRHQPAFAIGAPDAHVADPVAGLDFTDAGAGGLDHAHALNAEHQRQRFRPELAGPVVNIDEIEADGGVA